MPSAGVLFALLALAGAGLGLSSAGMQASAVEAVGPRDAGAASGMYSTSRYIGSIAGSSLLPVLLAAPGNGPVFVLIAGAAGLSVVAGAALGRADLAGPDHRRPSRHPMTGGGPDRQPHRAKELR